MNQARRFAALPVAAAFLGVLSGFAAKASITIMPMGDSGTVGVDYYTDTSGGYRDPLYQDLVASGIAFKFIGSNNSAATPLLTAAGQTYHNGYGGYTIEDMDANLSGSAAPLYGGDGNAGGYWLTSGSAGGAVVQPTIILLEAGANDFIKEGSVPLATVEGYLQKLVTDIHALTPNTVILVAGIYPFSLAEAADNSTIQSYNSWIQSTLVPALSYTRYVDNYTSFFNGGTVNALLLGADGIHPTRYGYPLWASNWAAAILTLEGSHPTLYNVAVNNGTVNNVATSGSYPAGSVVMVNSNTPSSGNQFAYWSPGTQLLDNPYWQIATYTVPAVSSTITANYAATGSPAIPNGTYAIVSGSFELGWFSGLSMGASGTSSGSLVQEQTYTSGSTQEWTVTNLPSVNGTSNVVELSLPGTNVALGVVSASRTAGANLDVETYTGALSQQWVITPLLGTTEIVNLNSGQAVNINGYVVSPGWDLVQSTAGYAANQVWAFFPLTSGSASSSAPSAPTGLAATAGNTAVGLSWTASPGATSYDIYRGNSTGGESATPVATGITTTSATDTGLTNGTTYYYEVAAVNSSGTSGYSNESNATPSAGGSVPAAPSGLTATAGNTTVSLNWTASASATSYNIYSGTSSGGESATPVASGVTGVSYTNTGLTNGTPYYYKVAAVDASGTSGYSNEATATPSSGAGTGSGTSSVISVVYGSSTAITGGVSAGFIPETVWNNDPTNIPYFGVGSTSLSNLTDSNNNNSGITETLTTYAGYHQGAAVTGFSSAGNNALYNHGPYTGTAPSQGGVLTLAGLNAALTYDLYIYVNDPNGAAGTSIGVTNSVNSQGYYLKTISSASINSFVLGSATTSGAAASGNYFALTGLTGATTLTASLASSGAAFDGFQLVVHSAASSAPATPTGLTATPGNALAALNWTASTGATSYNIYRGTATGGESAIPVANSVTTSATDSGLTNGITYYYKIAAVNSSGTSGYSSEAAVTPNTTYVLTVNGGSGSGIYAAGATVTVTASAAATGYQFAGWTGATSALANPASATTTLTMPAAATAITATYTAIPTYTLTVNNGSGGGAYAAGAMVTVTANAPSSGYQFAAWTGATSALANPSSAMTTLTMPAAATAITATYTVIPTYTLTVNNGSGGGNYAAGTVVNVAANAPASGYQFAGWTGATGALANPSAASTTLTMPAAAAAITATYSQGGGTTSTPTVTSVQFPQYYGNSVVSALNSNNYTAGVISVQNWNVADTNAGTSPASNSTSLISSTGGALGSSILINSAGGNTATGFTYSGYVSNDHTNNKFPSAITSWEGGQADSFLAAGTSFNTSGAAETLTVSGLNTNDTYNLIVYVAAPWWSNGGSDPATVGAGGTNYYVMTSGTLGSWTQATSTASGSPGTGNYVEFNNLTGAAAQTVTITGAYVGLEGFQLVDQGAVSGYPLTVTNGSGSGTYGAGTAVTVTANAPASGYEFAGWTGSTGALANSAAETTTLSMPLAAASITATYSLIPSYALTVTSGSGSGSYTPGTVVTVTANAPAGGYQFVGWTGAGTAALGNPSAATTTLTMPSAATSVAAAYALTTADYSLTVTNGSGSGTYTAGTAVTVTANAAASGYRFAGWTGATSALFDPAQTTTTLTMPAAPASVTAGYASTTTTYPLTVNGGTGSGNYAPGTIVTVSANAPASGYQFARWTGTTAALDLGNADESTTTITMPPVATMITSSYALVPQTYAVTVNGGSGGGSYAAGTVVTVSASAPASGYNFTGWTGGTNALANAAFATTTLTVPASAVAITAGYSVTTASNALTVASGTGSGTYAPGTAVTVAANAPATGYQFAGWTGSTSYLANAASPSTIFNMPSGAASITANYAAISSTGTLVLAVGLEKIVPGYSGPAIRIQRPVDNAQEDIGFATGSSLLNTAAVSAFLGQDQGFITMLYDQTGNGNNVTSPLPASTSTMPTISVTDPTSISINGVPNLTARDLEAQYAYGQGNQRYFVVPNSVSVNKSQMSAFIACSPDYSGGITPMDLYQIGNAATDAVDLISSPSGLQGLSHNSAVTFSNNNVIERSQQTVVGLVTSPGTVPALYLDGVGYTSRGTTPASVTCSGGNLAGGTGQYNFLGFSLYSGAVSPATAAAISNAMIPRAVPAYNILADGDSITQGTGSIYGFNMVHYLSGLLNEPADITDIAIYGTTSPSAVGHASSPTPQDSADGMIYDAGYTKNLYYVDIGTNDIHGGFLSGTGAWGQVQQALEDAKALGYTTIVATLLHENGETATSGTQINIFNSLARAAVGQYYIDGLVDYEADARLGNTSNYYPAFSGDGTHPNDAGYQIMSTIAAPVFNKFVGLTYAQWAGEYFASDPANDGETATPWNDGVSNLLKDLFDINPSRPMNASDRAALPAAGMTTIGGSSYLTLTYRQNPTETGLAVNVQTSVDLQTWQTVTPNYTVDEGTDAATGDPLVQFQVLINPANTPKEFIRLYVTGP